MDELDIFSRLVFGFSTSSLELEQDCCRKCICVLFRYLNEQGYGLKCENIQFFSNHKWGNLSKINLSRNQIGSKGCKYLSKMELNNVANVGLQQNVIEGEGILHLSKRSMPNLHIINLVQNRINYGVRWAVRAKYPKVKYVYLHSFFCGITIQSNPIVSEQQSKHFVLSNLKQLRNDGYQIMQKLQKDRFQ